ncbi:kinase-like protein [Punctularia strigosozonata HHB-11173 SS5]|uniref:kinase-like protein n=1 Tax=Punctularia strigosozonata (strain HHB-11173) TaxID=741275 RepID=UPI00044186BB|nr:kinase-like protein [Punctularia strigosozonata HHB-11173 SS5]EIN13116.1 kinase-like protein [Punctularia strigosozonata HHB-11173 SS5]
MEQIARESQEWDRQWQHEIAYVLHRLFRLGLRMRERKFKPALRKRILKWMRRENVEATASPREEFSMIHVAILVPSLVATAPGRSWTQITQQSALNKAREILSSKESMREAMLLEGQEALDMVDLLDQTADVFSGIYRQRAMWLLSRLCKRCGLLPSSCCISEVLQRITRDPLFTGGFADVYRGQLGSRDVALKVLRVFGGSSGRNDVLKAFCKEAALWKRLRHPNVVPFLGVSTTAFEGRLCLLSPWLAHGHVRMYLEDHPDSNRLKFLLDVTLVLEYLHSLRVTHGDLKGVNILIDDDLRARLADFGLTVISSDPSVAQAMDVTTAMQEAGSTRWMAPELFDPSVPCAPNTASDIYALAMVFWEIFAGENPFPEMRMEPAVIQKVSRGDRPPRPLFGLSLGLSDPIWALMERCWQHQSALRPGVEEIVPIVQKAHAAFIPARATMPRKPDANDDRSSLDALFVDK